MLVLRVAKAREITELRMGESGPEKAGVGGSIPSLATMFSMTYSHPLLRLVHWVPITNSGLIGVCPN